MYYTSQVLQDRPVPLICKKRNPSLVSDQQLQAGKYKQVSFMKQNSTFSAKYVSCNIKCLRVFSTLF